MNNSCFRQGRPPRSRKRKGTVKGEIGGRLPILGLGLLERKKVGSLLERGDNKRSLIAHRAPLLCNLPSSLAQQDNPPRHQARSPLRRARSSGRPTCCSFSP